ncbi:MAG: hypothetical protein DWQ42_20350 [Planctomycetota bacterium]|nr:MAG: hypothetical protein DWQ42_20350 [Planctomycetota bacterium]REK40461.1 MAG: hypothetical protein DWQ46_16360 [Planctomycetota bacterium]
MRSGIANRRDEFGTKSRFSPAFGDRMGRERTIRAVGRLSGNEFDKSFYNWGLCRRAGASMVSQRAISAA